MTHSGSHLGCKVLDGESDSNDASVLNNSFTPAAASAETISTTSENFKVVGARRDLVSVTTPAFGPNPVEADCPFCQAHIVTSTQRIAGVLPWIFVTICFILGFFLILPWCLCSFAFCIESCLDVNHFCPSCKRFLYRHKKF